MKLKPKETWTWQWLPLSDWGYDLREPGTYTIEGMPAIFGPEVEEDWKSVRSNRAAVTIVP